VPSKLARAPPTKKELGVVGARQGTPRKATSAPPKSPLVSASGMPKSVGKLP
jgi:hypothetical protein